MPLLSIIKDACNELVLTAPNTVIGNTDLQIQQLLALSNREGQEFVKLRGPWDGWQELNKVYSFNLVPVGPYTGTLTPNSNVISNMSSVANLAVGFGVAGTGVYPACVITSINAGMSQITVSTPPSATSVTNNVSLTFGQIAYDLPGDLQHFQSATAWDTNFRWQLLGPLSVQEQEVIERGISPVGPRIRYWLQDGKFNIQPLPGLAQFDLISMRYISNAWCNKADGTPRAAVGGVCRWGADTDTYIWPEDVMVLGIKWRFLRAKGLPYDEEYDTWATARDVQLATSGSSRNLPMNATANGIRLLSNQNVPDTGFGQ